MRWGLIVHLGTNYVVVQISEDRTIRKWLDDVTKVELTEEKIPSNLRKAMKSRNRSLPK